ncbi:Uncharacterized protein APZ42_024702 [Daphnia magna]|uniref:Uncharacterized protein n=1 Tax=Daphnia magna TaxID=35525 RepID=A0A164TV42_9CRUS|nr:Uncharacterized protein APZ42_024702 [Daphnia magna]
MLLDIAFLRMIFTTLFSSYSLSTLLILLCFFYFFYFVFYYLVPDTYRVVGYAFELVN